MRLSACIEWLYAAEAPSFVDRIWLAKRDGLRAIEFWTWSDKDLDQIESTIRSAEIGVSSIVAEPMIPLTDIANQGAFLAGLKRSVEVAVRLRTPVLIAQAGSDLANVSRQHQKAALIETLALSGAVLEGSGIRIGLEPLNTLVDHPGYFLASTEEALEIVAATGRDEIGLVYDIYHSAVMGENTEAVIGGNIDRVFHLHLADHPGRHEPGTGKIDLRKRLGWLAEQGYSGFLGLEYRPIASTTASISQCRRVLWNLRQFQSTIFPPLPSISWSTL